MKNALSSTDTFDLHLWSFAGNNKSGVIAFASNDPPPSHFPLRAPLYVFPLHGTRGSRDLPGYFKLDIYLVIGPYMINRALFSWDRKGRLVQRTGGVRDIAAKQSNMWCTLDTLASTQLSNLGMDAATLQNDHIVRFFPSHVLSWTPLLNRHIELVGQRTTTVIFRCAGIDFEGLSLLCYRLSPY